MDGKHFILFPSTHLSTKGMKRLPENDLQLPGASFDFCSSSEQCSELSPDFKISLLIINPHNSTQAGQGFRQNWVCWGNRGTGSKDGVMEKFQD